MLWYVFEDKLDISVERERLLIVITLFALSLVQNSLFSTLLCNT